MYLKQINIFMEMVICVTVDGKSDGKLWEGLSFYKFPRGENLKQ